MTKKKQAKKKSKAKKFFVISREWGCYECDDGHDTEAAALAAIEKNALDNGYLGTVFIVEKTGTVKVSLKVDSVKKTVKK